MTTNDDFNPDASINRATTSAASTAKAGIDAVAADDRDVSLEAATAAERSGLLASVVGLDVEVRPVPARSPG